MRRALRLARRAAGRTSPNPMVGAVVVRDGRVVGEGYHARAGAPHAEAHALRAAGAEAAGATLYVTLEPCDHHGRTPPCTEAIIAAGVRRVVAAAEDPNPLVAGRGLERLRAAGLTVETGVLEDEARALNEAFFKFISTGRPFVTWKYAMSLDGKVAAHTGVSRWISGERARTLVHRLRAGADAIMVGVGTALADDPLLTARGRGGHGGSGGRDPVRVIVDSRLRLPATARVLHPGSAAPTWVATTPHAPAERRRALEAAGAEVLMLPDAGGRVHLPALMDELGRRQVTSVLCEGGPTLAAALLEDSLIDKVYCFISPRLIGGAAAPGALAGTGSPNPDLAWRLHRAAWRRVGEDLLAVGYVSEAAAARYVGGGAGAASAAEGGGRGV